MNIGQKTNLREDTNNKVLCVIVATGEERPLIPVYDSSITTGLTASESRLKLGKFCAWKDPNTDEYFKPRSEAYPKPQEPFELFGVECDKGWDELIQPLFDWIEKYNKEHEDDPIVIEQVKEKFGGLRFYVSYEPDELSRMIRKAEGDSYGICEVCGSKIDVGHTSSGWIKTICRKCSQTSVNECRGKNQVKWKSIEDGCTHLITKEGLI